MSNIQFLRSERSTRRKAFVFTIIFHAMLFGGLAFGTEMGDKVTDQVKEWFQDDQSETAEKEPLAKNKK